MIFVKLPIEEVLPRIGEPRLEYYGISVGSCSKRLKCFRDHGCDCKACGARGAYFALERRRRYRGMWHLSLYALNQCGHPVLMTRDHVIPRSKGGSDGQTNSQPLCLKCNYKKADDMPEESMLFVPGAWNGTRYKDAAAEGEAREAAGAQVQADRLA